MNEPTQVAAEMRQECETYVGRQRETEDTMAPEPAARLAVLLGGEAEREFLPPTYHWLYFAKGIPFGDIGADMHEKTGIFLPPAPFHRRMWAAGDVTVLQPLRIGARAMRRSTIAEVSFKEGRSGHMCFVTVLHEIEQGGKPCISEKQTIVYRDRGAPEMALRQPGDPVPDGYFVHPDSMLWFYSAVTYNGHRIHWDRDFCRETEGYPDLVVHGPLMATELCEAMRDTFAPLRFVYRAQAPVFTTTPVRIEAERSGNERRGEIQRSDGVVSMTAALHLL